MVDFTKDAEEAPYLFIILFFHFNVTASNKDDILGLFFHQCWFVCLPLKKLRIDSAGIFLEGLVVAPGTTYWILVMVQIMRLECQRWKNKIAKICFFQKKELRLRVFQSPTFQGCRWGIYGFL